MTAKHQSPYLPVRLDLENERVWRGEQVLKLTPKAFAVVRYLIEHAGRLVTKAQLLGAVWPDTVVSEWALTSCMRELRKVLQDTPKAPQYIETVHRRGYRFLPAITTTPLMQNVKLTMQNAPDLRSLVPNTQSSVLSTLS